MDKRTNTETRAEDLTALRTQNEPPKFAQLYSPTGSKPTNCAPECCTQRSIVPIVQPITQVISPGPVNSATLAAAHASHATRSSLQRRHTPAEEAYSTRKLPPRGKNVCARTATGSDDRSRDHQTEPRITLTLKLEPKGS